MIMLRRRQRPRRSALKRTTAANANAARDPGRNGQSPGERASSSSVEASRPVGRSFGRGLPFNQITKLESGGEEVESSPNVS